MSNQVVESYYINNKVPSRNINGIWTRRYIVARCKLRGLIEAKSGHTGTLTMPSQWWSWINPTHAMMV